MKCQELEIGIANKIIFASYKYKIPNINLQFYDPFISFLFDKFNMFFMSKKFKLFMNFINNNMTFLNF